MLGFTLIELMIVVLIVAVLASLAVTTYSRYVVNADGRPPPPSCTASPIGRSNTFWTRGSMPRT